MWRAIKRWGIIGAYAVNAIALKENLFFFHEIAKNRFIQRLS